MGYIYAADGVVPLDYDKINKKGSNIPVYVENQKQRKSPYLSDALYSYRYFRSTLFKGSQGKIYSENINKDEKNLPTIKSAIATFDIIKED